MCPEKLLQALAFQIPTRSAEMSPGCKGSIRMLTPGEDPPLKGLFMYMVLLHHPPTSQVGEGITLLWF